MHYRIYLFLALLGIFQPIKTERSIVDGRQYRCDLSLRSTFSVDRPYVLKDYRKTSPVLVIHRHERSQDSSRFRDQADLRFIRQDTREDRLTRKNYGNSFIRAFDRREPERIERNFQRLDEHQRFVSRRRQGERIYRNTAPVRNEKQRNIDQIRNQIRSQSINRMRQNERHVARQLERSVSEGRFREMGNVVRQISERRIVSHSTQNDNREALSRNAMFNQYDNELTIKKQLDHRRNPNNNNRRVFSEFENRVRLTENNRRMSREARLSQRNDIRTNFNLNIQNRPSRDSSIVKHQIAERRTEFESNRRNLLRDASTQKYREDLVRAIQLHQHRDDIHRRNILSERDSRLKQRENPGTPELRLLQRNEFRNERSSILINRDRFVKMEREVRTNRIASETIERPQRRSLLRSYITSRNFEDQRSTSIRRERTALRDSNNSQYQEQRLTISRKTKSYMVQIRYMERDIIDGHARDVNVQSYRKDDARQTERRNKISRTIIGRERVHQREEGSRSHNSELARQSKVNLRDVPRERTSRGNAERILRYDISRNVFNASKNNDISILSHWDVLIYTLQGIYLCSVLFKIFTRCDSSLQKPRSFGWFAITNPIKLD